MIKKAWIIVLLINLGCAPYVVSVNSIAGPKDNTAHRYVLRSGIEGIAETDLQFQEFCRYIERALTEKGYVKSDNPEDADMVIFLRYGIGDKEVLPYIYSTPVYGKISGGMANFDASTRDSFGNYSHTTGTISSPDQYGVVGSKIHTEYHTTYLRYLRLDAIDYIEYKKNQKINVLWQTEAVSRGASDDLQEVFPYLVIAAMPYFGKNTEKQLRVSLMKTDEQVKKLKLGALSQK